MALRRPRHLGNIGNKEPEPEPEPDRIYEREIEKRREAFEENDADSVED